MSEKKTSTTKKYVEKTVTLRDKTTQHKPLIQNTRVAVQTIPLTEILAAIPHLPKAPREACQDCSRQHLAQAVILLTESLMGYPEYKWLAVGHLAEASEKCLGEFPEVALLIREDRLKIVADIMPDLMRYLRDDFEILTVMGCQDNQ